MISKCYVLASAKTIRSSVCFMLYILQKTACMAVRNIVARRQDLVDAFINRGVEPHLRRAMALHKCSHDEAHAALRDLGCQVELKELWTGSGSTQLQQ